VTDDGRGRLDVASVEEVIEAGSRGEMVVVVDDADRENEGDLFVPAEKATPEHVNFMATHGRGLVCAPVTAQRLDELDLRPMVPPAENSEEMGTAFAVSVDATTTDTGISAHDRAATVEALVDPATTPEDLDRPGHTFPLEAREGGVLERRGHTEAAVDLARLAGLKPAGVVCEIMADDGTMAREPELVAFAEEHDLLVTTVERIVEYRLRNEQVATRTVETVLPTEYGRFDLYAYEYLGDTHVALASGDTAKDRPLVRVHSRCVTGDTLHSRKCDCGFQLDEALEAIGREGGVLVYLDQEGRGIGLLNKLRAYELQERGYDTVEANEELGFEPDERRFDAAAQILRDLDVQKCTLLTNNPEKVANLERLGLDVDRRGTAVSTTEENVDYLETKREKLGHRFTIQH